MALGDVGVAAGDERLAEPLHLLDVLGGARLYGRRQNAEGGDVVVELLLGRARHAADGLVEREVGEVLGGARVDLVVDVRDVADIGDVVGAVDVAQ
jgi:hypothetical protein